MSSNTKTTSSIARVTTIERIVKIQRLIRELEEVKNSMGEADTYRVTKALDYLETEKEMQQHRFRNEA